MLHVVKFKLCTEKKKKEIQAIFERKIIHILLEEGEKIILLSSVYFRFVNRLTAELSVHCLFLFSSVQKNI